MQISLWHLWSILVSPRVELNVSREYHSTATNSNNKPQHSSKHYISWRHPCGCHRYCPDNHRWQHNNLLPRQLHVSSVSNIVLCWIGCNCKCYFTAILCTGNGCSNHFSQSNRQCFTIHSFLREFFLCQFPWMGYFSIPKPNYFQSSGSLGECLGGSGTWRKHDGHTYKPWRWWVIILPLSTSC